MTPFRICDIDHVVLVCADVKAMLDFYCGVLGCTIAKHNERLGLIHLRAGSAMIDLVDRAGELGRGVAGGSEPRRTNMDHFCLRIDPFDIEELSVHLAAHGLEPGELRTRFGAQGDGPSIYLQDPEGNRVEIKGVLTNTR
jgi:glyoxylase I family protein